MGNKCESVPFSGANSGESHTISEKMIKIRSITLILLTPLIFLFVLWQFRVIDSAHVGETTEKVKHLFEQNEHGVATLRRPQAVAPDSVRIYIGIVTFRRCDKC